MIATSNIFLGRFITAVPGIVEVNQAFKFKKGILGDMINDRLQIESPEFDSHGHSLFLFFFRFFFVSDLITVLNITCGTQLFMCSYPLLTTMLHYYNHIIRTYQYIYI